MVLAPGDLPDWLRGYLLIGQDADGNPIVLLADADGQLKVVLTGEDSGGASRVVQVDADGQLYVVLRGADDVDVAVDSSGFLSALIKGVDGGAVLRTVAVDTAGQIVMVPRGQSGNYMLVDSDGFMTSVFKGVDGGAALRTIAVDTSGQTIMVPRGQSGNYMLVDSDGYLTAVLKGIQAGELTTISVDANGRLEAFGLDAESQWGDVLKTGNSELAARLGALKNWDWRGQVAWQSDFGLGLGNALKYPTGTGSAITIDPTYWLNGGYAVKMVGGSDGDHKAYIDFLVETPASLQIGLEVAFSYVSQMEFFKIEVRCYTGGKIYTAAIRYNDDTSNVQYLNSSNVWTNIANPYYLSGGEMFHRLKFTADFSTVKYGRVLYGSTEVDLSAQSIRQSGTGYLSSLYIEVELNSRSGENDVAYLDSIILTTMEP